jgi:hypothetical protein
VVGRDAYFIGDLFKLKLVWFENLRFYDFSNYFEGKPFNYFTNRWLSNPDQRAALMRLAGEDSTHYRVLSSFEIVNKFIEELQSIAFNNGKNYYDLSLHCQASASSLALSIF